MTFLALLTLLTNLAKIGQDIEPLLPIVRDLFANAHPLVDPIPAGHQTLVTLVSEKIDPAVMVEIAKLG